MVQDIKNYTIDLDLPPEKRWIKVIKDHKEECMTVYNKIDEMMDSSVITNMGKVSHLV